MNRTSQYMKRAIDIVVASIGLLLLLPMIAIMCLLVYLFMGPPIFFRQQRPGLHGKPFALVKFRTLTNERDSLGNLLPHVERQAPFGQFLRRTSLDELPEFLNVLRGEMSLVGPRPLLMEYLEYYSPEQARRHNVKPGITGLAQVRGRNALTWEEKFAYDNWYVDHQSLGLDMSILLQTMLAVLRQEGIDQEGVGGAEPFRGS